MNELVEMIPTSAKAVIGGGVLVGAGALGLRVVAKLSDYALGRVGAWFESVDAAVQGVAKLAVGIEGIKAGQAGMQDYLCERIENVRTELAGKIETLEAKSTGEDRVLAGRVAAMESTVSDIVERQNAHSQRLQLVGGVGSGGDVGRVHASVRPIPPRRPRGNGNGSNES